jgi:hypothetical protein
MRIHAVTPSNKVTVTLSRKQAERIVSALDTATDSTLVELLTAALGK